MNELKQTSKFLTQIKSFFLGLLEIGLCAAAFYPILYALSTSLKTQEDYFKSPIALFTAFSVENYLKTLQDGFLRYFINSTVVAVIGIAIVVIISAMASYAFVRLDFKLNKLLNLIVLSGMMLPIHASLIPIFILENKTGLYDTLMGVTLPQVAFSIPISIFIISQFLEGIPFSIIESAKIDGANHYTIFRKIILPLLRPALATVIIYNTVRIWNNFSFPLIFSQSKRIFTIPLGLQAFYGEFSVNVPGILSAICLATFPILFVYYCMQKTIEQGITGGAVKE